MSATFLKAKPKGRSNCSVPLPSLLMPLQYWPESNRARILIPFLIIVLCILPNLMLNRKINLYRHEIVKSINFIEMYLYLYLIVCIFKVLDPNRFDTHKTASMF